MRRWREAWILLSSVNEENSNGFSITSSSDEKQNIIFSKCHTLAHFFHSFICPAITFFHCVFFVQYLLFGLVASHLLTATKQWLSLCFHTSCAVSFFPFRGCFTLAYDRIASWISCFPLSSTLCPRMSLIRKGHLGKYPQGG